MVLVTLFGFFVGTIIGSFVKATVDRLIVDKTLKGRSSCDDCHHTLSWIDLIPLFSFLSLKGRCRYCKKSITKANIIFEVVLGFIIAYVFYHNFTDYGSLEQFIIFAQSGWINLLLFILNLSFQLFVVAVLSIIFWVDLKTYLIHDRITYPTIVVAFVVLLLEVVIRSIAVGASPSSLGFNLAILPIWQSFGVTLLSAIAAPLFFVSLIVVTRGKGMGWGDVKYVIFLGLILGFPNILIGLFSAFLLGAIVAVFLLVLGQKKIGQVIPFGPFLSLGGFIALFWGKDIIYWYLFSFGLN